MNKFSVNFCPVPLDQQPINEYQQLKEAWLFNWGTLAIGKYCKKVIWVSLWSLIFAAPLSMSIYSPGRHSLEFALSCAIGVALLTGLFLSRIYLGWQYIKGRLKRDRIFYEESGWYDGQTWLKPATMLDRDRLIVSYEIDPILDRFHKTYGLIAAIIIFSGLLWLILA